MIKIKKDKLKYKRISKIEDFLNLNVLQEGIVLAGGALRTLIDNSEEIADYDVFFLESEHKFTRKNKVEQKLINLGFIKTYQCVRDELRSFERDDMKIQLIDLKESNYEDVEDLLDSFDINASRIAFYKDEFYIFSQSIKDVKKKHITINKITYPIATFKRIIKFSNKGYKINLAARFMLEDTAKRAKEDKLWEDEVFNTIYID